MKVIYVNKRERALVSSFMGEAFPKEMDYNRLMSIVEKIEDCRDFDDFGFSFTIDNWQAVVAHCLSGEIRASILSAKSKIDAVWQAVVQFIAWYLSNQLPAKNHPSHGLPHTHH